MEIQSRRGLLKNAAKAAAVATGGVMLSKAAKADAPAAEKQEKKSYPPRAASDTAPPPLFSGAVSYGNLLFLAGVGAHFQALDPESRRVGTGLPKIRGERSP